MENIYSIPLTIFALDVCPTNTQGKLNKAENKQKPKNPQKRNATISVHTVTVLLQS